MTCFNGSVRLPQKDMKNMSRYEDHFCNGHVSVTKVANANVGIYDTGIVWSRPLLSNKRR